MQYAHADSLGLTLEHRSMLRVSPIWKSTLSHSAIGKSGSHVARDANMWFLKVLIARSAAFWRWMCGGTLWKSSSYFNNAAFNSLEHSLSNIHKFGAHPRFERVSWISSRLFLLSFQLGLWAHDGECSCCHDHIHSWSELRVRDVFFIYIFMNEYRYLFSIFFWHNFGKQMNKTASLLTAPHASSSN